MTGYSVRIDWQEEFKRDVEKWQNEGQRVAREILEDKDHEKHKELLEYLGYNEEPKYPDDVAYEHFEPMMNYAYPLECEPNDEDIYRVITETNLTVMYNDDTDEYFLVLTGGGMDLSQDIGLAYIILETWIPASLLREINTQPELSVGGKKYIELMEKVKEQLKMEAGRNTEHIKIIDKRLKEYWKEHKE